MRCVCFALFVVLLGCSYTGNHARVSDEAEGHHSSVIESEDATKLVVGMSKSQVESLLGVPERKGHYACPAATWPDMEHLSAEEREAVTFDLMGPRVWFYPQLCVEFRMGKVIGYKAHTAQ